ncbi:T9SS type A sorting domain-containing protein [Dyadobacter sp. CY261]|uniref:T9SS type A sorting domain-containing protein n=1 Tax=Dyadobacter sp. CY261 TaxID=2907203 RepID=UPI001F249950|nr:T9SS type A sorting domain-containing protein [Dyadobacter sp. CY261]MCF0069307.1 T9SS type A sorting domain-containing protein [Dyadobacter sp. CY261]
MLKHLLFLSLCFSFFHSFSQTPSLRIERVYSENYCLGTELKIDVTIDGTFPADNKFTVVAYRGWNESAKQWEYPAELRGHQLVTVLKELSLASSESFEIKVISSNPKTEVSASGPFKALTKSAVHLTTRWGLTADTLNSNDQIALALTTRPMSPGKVVLTTGDTIQLEYSYYDWTAGYATNATLPRTRDGTYSIKEASSVCGPMDVSGQVKIKVNAMDFLPVDVSPERPCEGSEIKVTFNTQGGEFNANTKFRVRFASDNSYIDSYRYIDAPATLTGKNELTARVPDLGYTLRNQGVYIGIVTENPVAVSLNKALKVYFYEKPSFSLVPSKTDINLGDEVYISGNPTGRPPYKLTLTTGEVFQNSVYINPLQTTQYQVSKFESGCGIIENPPQTPVVIRVQPSLLVGDGGVTPSTRIFCEGQTARVRLRAVGVTAQTTYTVECSTNSNQKFRFPAKLLGDSLEFWIPKNTIQDAQHDYGAINGIRVTSANPSLTSLIIGIRIQGMPFMTQNENAQTSVPYPSPIGVGYNLHGGRPYVLERMDGRKEIYDQSYFGEYVYVKKDTTFKLASLSNACAANSDLTAFPLKVAKPTDTTPAMLARFIKKDSYCAGDSAEVEVLFSGKFEEGNKFTLSFPEQNESSPPITITKPGIYKIKLPEKTARYTAYFELSSTLPRLTSTTIYYFVETKPQPSSVSPATSKENPESMYVGNSPSVIVYSTSYSTINYSVDGKENSILADNNGMRWVPLDLTHNKVSEFRLNSITNTCGSITSDVKTYIRGIGYKLVMEREIFPTWHCVGSDAEALFGFESGAANAGTRFTLQISPSGDQNSYTDLATSTDNRAIRFIVPNLEPDSYYLRIRSSDDIYSDAINIRIGRVPTAVLVGSSANSSQDSVITVEYGSQAYLRAYVEGDQPWGLVYSDGEQQQVNSNYTSYGPIVTSEKTFTINKVWNSCGYGQSGSSVRVRIKPILELKKYPENADPVICAGQKIQLDYQVKGATLQNNQYLVFSLWGDNGEQIKLDSVNKTTGRIELAIPAGFTGQIFRISADLRALEISKAVVYQLYASPDMTIFGDNIITAGESTTLFVRANNTFPYGTMFQLSDGKSHPHTAPFKGGITEVKITPSATTTYTLQEPATVCGTGKVSGSAAITVQPKLSQWLSINSVSGLRQSQICNSDTLIVNFYHNGSNAGSTEYEIQLSDSTGKNFALLPTFGSYSQLSAIVPTGLKKSDFYRLRIVAKDPQVSGSTYSERLRIGEHATARVLTPDVYYKAGQPIEAVIGLEGSSPFSYRFGDGNFSQYRSAASYTDTIRINGSSPVAEYRILQLNNVCGPGKIGDPASFKIELITATEPTTLGELITFGPNPTGSVLTVRFESASARQLEVLNAAGNQVYIGKSNGQNASIDLSKLPAGLYFLQVRKKDIITTHRVIKY